MAPEKTMGPSTTITFAGIELDSVEMEARLPQNKVAKCKEFISEFLERWKVKAGLHSTICWPDRIGARIVRVV